MIFLPGSPTIAQHLRVQLGLHAAALHPATTQDPNIDFRVTPGGQAGAMLGIDLGKGFSVETGLRAYVRGAKYWEFIPASRTIGAETHDIWTYFLYTDVLLRARVTRRLGSVQVFAAAGPYLGAGLWGRYWHIATFDTWQETTQGRLPWGPDPATGDLRRLDYGVSLALGVQFRQIEVSLYGDRGIPSLSSEGERSHLAGGVAVAYRWDL